MCLSCECCYDALQGSLHQHRAARYNPLQVCSAAMAVGLSMFLVQPRFLLSVAKQPNTSFGISVSFILRQPLSALELIIDKNLNYSDVYGDFLLPSHVYGTCNVHPAADIINLFPAVSLLTPIQESYYRQILSSWFRAS